VHNKDGFHINLDVQQFKQDAVIVRTVGYYVITEAKHEEKQDDNRVLTRQMTRKYMSCRTTWDVDVEKIVSKLTSDGMLHVKIPKRAPPPPPDSEEKVIPIIYTHTPDPCQCWRINALKRVFYIFV
jgi:HSP20 family molecular chaperone IbpA